MLPVFLNPCDLKLPDLHGLLCLELHLSCQGNFSRRPEPLVLGSHRCVPPPQEGVPLHKCKKDCPHGSQDKSNGVEGTVLLPNL